MTNVHENEFNAWLDGLVAGRSTPAAGTPATPEMTGVRAAARKLHHLARMAEADTAIAGNDDPQLSTWSTFMEDHATALPAARPVASPRRPRPRVGPWLTGLNIAMAAVIIAAMGAGFWRYNDNANGPGGDGNDNLAFAPETRTFEPDGTPETIADLPPVPTADECTVEPLSIDTVLWYYADPDAAARGIPPESEQDGTPAVVSEYTKPADLVMLDQGVFLPNEVEVTIDPNSSSTPPSYPNFEPGPASPDQLAAMASLQRMWMACVLAESPFQRWALESPLLVAEQVQMLLPAFAGEDEARAILEDVQATGVLEPSDDFWNQPNASYQMLTSYGYPSGGSAAVIETDNAESWTTDGRTFWVTYSTYSFDGELRRVGNLTAMYTPESDQPTPIPGLDGTGGCMRFGITWFPDSEQLLVSYYPHCG